MYQEPHYDSISRRPVFIGLLIIVLLSGCSSGANNGIRYPQQYQQASASSDGVQSASTDSAYEQLEGFITLFANLKQPEIDRRIRSVYAKSLYFNDTLKTHTDLESLVTYLVSTSRNLDYGYVEIEKVIASGPDYFVVWTMYTGFTAMGKSVQAHSIGMSQIRLNVNGKVVFHQDFWDNSEGQYRHLPIVGSLISYAERRM